MNENLEEQVADPVQAYTVVDSDDLNISLSTLNDLSPEQLKELYIKGIQDNSLWGAYGKNYKNLIREGQTECERHALCLSPPRMMMFDHGDVYTTEFYKQLNGCILREDGKVTIYKCPFCPKDTAKYCLKPDKEEISMHNEYFSARKLGMHIYRYHYPMQNQVHCPFCEKSRTVGAMPTAVLFIRHLTEEHDELDKQRDRKTTNEPIEENVRWFKRVMTQGKSTTIRRQVYISKLKIQALPNNFYIPPLIPNNNFMSVSKGNKRIIAIGPFRMYYSTFKDNPMNCFNSIEELVQLCKRTDNPKDLTVEPKVIQDLNNRRKIGKTTSIDKCIRAMHIKKDLLRDERGNSYRNRELPRDVYFEDFGSSVKDNTDVVSRKRQVDASDSLDGRKERKTQRRIRRVEKPRPRATTVTREQRIENPNSREMTVIQPDISIQVMSKQTGVSRSTIESF